MTQINNKLSLAWPVAKIFALGLIVRMLTAFVVLGSMPLRSDALSYAQLAESLLNRSGAGIAFYWPPGNSFMLLAVYWIAGPTLAASRAAAVLLSAITVALTMGFSHELLRSRTVTLATGLLAALYMPAVMLSGQTYSQHLASACLVATAWAALHAAQTRQLRFAAMAGVAFGFGCLTRPSMFSVSPVLAFILLRRPPYLAGTSTPTHTNVQLHSGRARRVTLGFLALFMAAMVVIPVQHHNSICGGGWAISTNNERNFFLGNNPHTHYYKTSHLGQRSLDQLDQPTREYLQGFYNRPDARSAMAKEAINYIIGHPVTSAYRSLNRSTSFWGFDYLASRNIQGHYRLTNHMLLLPLALEAGNYIVVLLLVIMGLFCMRGHRNIWARRTLLALVLSYQIPYIVSFSGGSYHYPDMWLLLPVAGVAASLLLRTPDRRYAVELVKRRFAFWIVLAIFIVIQIQYAFYAVNME